jgi:formate-dependent nitrite reductase membrane component NrfD
MKKIISFLRWEFQGCTRSVSFWGAAIVILGVIMLVADCPRPWPFYTILLGFAMNFADITYSFVKFRISMYKLEQESVARKLQKD